MRSLRTTTRFKRAGPREFCTLSHTDIVVVLTPTYTMNQTIVNNTSKTYNHHSQNFTYHS